MDKEVDMVELIANSDERDIQIALRALHNIALRVGKINAIALLHHLLNLVFFYLQTDNAQGLAPGTTLEAKKRTVTNTLGVHDDEL